jgi:hypothetical protein
LSVDFGIDRHPRIDKEQIASGPDGVTDIV